MTKIDMGMSNTKDAASVDDVNKDKNDNNNYKNDDDEKKRRDQEAYAKLREMLGRIGMADPMTNEDVPTSIDDVVATIVDRPIGIDWVHIGRVSKAQLVLASLSMTCLFMSMLICGFNFYRFTSTAWAMYLISCGFIGYRAGKWQSYAHIVAYTGMCTFQTLVYMSTMCWLLYVVYALDARGMNGEYVSIHGRRHIYDAVLFLTLGEVLTLMGTVLTGVLGLVGCCRGFGRLLSAQEQLLEERRELMRTPRTV